MDTIRDRTSARPTTSGLMTFFRIAILSLLTFFALVMGSIPANERNMIANAFAPTIVVLGPLLYFLPTIEAYLRQHRSLTSIGLVNLFLGWTLVGWVAAIAWACAGTNKQQAAAAPATSLQPFTAFPAPGTAVATSVADELRKLAALREQGVLTENEFAQQKAIALKSSQS